VVTAPTGVTPSARAVSSSPVSRTTTRSGVPVISVVPAACSTVRTSSAAVDGADAVVPSSAEPQPASISPVTSGTAPHPFVRTAVLLPTPVPPAPGST